MKIDWMLVLLASLAVLIVATCWKAHRRGDIDFNLLDLLMENGRVSKIAVAFMLVLGVTTWVILNLAIHEKLTEGYFTMYGTMWVFPLVAKVVFNKTDPKEPMP